MAEAPSLSRLPELRERFEDCYARAVRLSQSPEDTLSAAEAQECLCEVDALMELAAAEAEHALLLLRSLRDVARDAIGVQALLMLTAAPIVLVVGTGGVLWLGFRWEGSGALCVLFDIAIVIVLYTCAMSAVSIYLPAYRCVWSPNLGSDLLAETEKKTPDAVREIWDLAQQAILRYETSRKLLREQASRYENPVERARLLAGPWTAAGCILALEFAHFMAAGFGWLFALTFALAASMVFMTGAAAISIAPRGPGLDFPPCATSAEHAVAIACRSPFLVAVGMAGASLLLPFAEAQLDLLAHVAEDRLAQAEEALTSTRRMRKALFARMMRVAIPGALIEKMLTGETLAKKAEHLQELSANAGTHAKVFAMSGARLLPTMICPQSVTAQERVRTAVGGVGDIIGGITCKTIAVTGLASPRAEYLPLASDAKSSAVCGYDSAPEDTGASHTPMRQVQRGVRQLSKAILAKADALPTSDAVLDPSSSVSSVTCAPRVEPSDDTDNMVDETFRRRIGLRLPSKAFEEEFRSPRTFN